MQFLTALFGGSENTILNAAFALGIVLILVLIGLWIMKVVIQTTGNMSRGRGKRLSIVESVQIDAKHKVIILRRDNVEHVIMTGGTQDVVIESGLAVDPPGRRHAPKPAANPVPETRPETAEPRPAMSSRPREAGTHPLPRQVSLLRNSLLRSSARDTHVIPIKGYNSDAPASDSATSGPVTQNNGQAKLGAATSSRIQSAPKVEGK